MNEPSSSDSPPPWHDHSFQPAGGPQTEAGKARSRRNALKHGLTATTLLPAVLGSEVLERHRQRLRAEWLPDTPTREILVDEMARHAAALEVVEQIEPAVLRTSATAMAAVRPDQMYARADLATGYDFMLTAAVSSDAIDRMTRYRRAHEKGYHQALQRLRELIDDQPPTPAPTLSFAPPFPLTEDNCQAYLIGRLQAPGHRCPKCGHPAGCWLPTRLRWQCTRCKNQCGIRDGTVLAKSPLPLAVWFAAIWCIVNESDVPLDRLAAVTKISRKATLRRLAARIQKAATSTDASILLVGLNRASGSALPVSEKSRPESSITHEPQGRAS